MKAAPPKAAEGLVALLIPPACREHVVGDLHERYTSRWRYLADAVLVVPCVIVSRIRRTTDPQVLLMEAFALYLSFVGAAWKLDRMSFLYQPWAFARLAIPVAVALVALMLRDAYANPGKPGGPLAPRKPLQAAVLAIGCACLSQAALSDASRLPRGILIFGGGMSLLLVFALRTFFPPGADRPRGAR